MQGRAGVATGSPIGEGGATMRQYASNSSGKFVTMDMNMNIRASLRQQLEYYFSRENLAKDVYLVAQMDDELFVNIDLVSGFKMVMQWTTDLEMVKSVLQESTHVVVDSTERKVRPNIKLRRREVDLKSLPADAHANEIASLVEELQQSPLETIAPGPKALWALLFATEEDAALAVDRLNQLTFRGQPLEACVVKETLLRKMPTLSRPQAPTAFLGNPMVMGNPLYYQQTPYMVPYGYPPPPPNACPRSRSSAPAEPHLPQRPQGLCSCRLPHSTRG